VDVFTLLFIDVNVGDFTWIWGVGFMGFMWFVSQSLFTWALGVVLCSWFCCNRYVNTWSHMVGLVLLVILDGFMICLELALI